MINIIPLEKKDCSFNKSIEENSSLYNNNNNNIKLK